MDLVDRGIIIVRKKQPYLDWVRNLPDPDYDVTLQRLNADSTAYLIPLFDDYQEGESFIKENYRLIFEHELNGWHLDEKDWPRDRTYKRFKEWFDIELHSMALDLVQGDIEKEEFEEL
ncbi:MAG: hypothetical protein ACE5OR_09610 [bacterium]